MANDSIAAIGVGQAAECGEAGWACAGAFPERYSLLENRVPEEVPFVPAPGVDAERLRRAAEA